jgi:dTDP-6-deoxy-L-talose 4-dehydrogenase (NAD+)
MTKVLVTGATGYIGTHVVEALLEKNAEVICVSRGGEHPNPNATSVVRDFADISVGELAEWGPLDLVVHLAWADGFIHDSPAHISNLPRHVEFLKRVMEARIPKFVGLGTMHEVGYWEGEINETTPNRPRSMYGIAKNAFREAARLETQKSAAIFQWLRAYYILGDDERNNSLFSKILRWENEGKREFPFNSGVNRYDFIDVRLLGRQIAAASLQSEIVGVIDCCSGKAVALRDQVEAFIEERGLQIRPEYGAFPDRSYDSPAVWGSVSKIAQIMEKESKRVSAGPVGAPNLDLTAPRS